MSFTKIILSFLQTIFRNFSINDKIIRIIVVKVHSKREKIVTILKSRLINSTLSAFIRIFNKYFFNLIISKKEFLIIKIGYSRRFEYYPFLNLDYYFQENFAIEKLFNQIVDIRKINLSNESCEEIDIRYFFDYLHKKDLSKVLKRLKMILIPGGKLVISFNERSLKKVNYSIDNFLVLLKNLDFNDISVNIQNKFFDITSYKKVEVSKRSYPKILLNKKYLDILSNNECLIIVDDKNDINLANLFGLDVLRQLNKNNKLIDKQDLDSDIILQNFDYHKRKINHIFLLNLLEFNFKLLYPELFRKIRQEFGKFVNIHIILPNKDFHNLGYLQFFNKGIIAKICDNNDLKIESIAIDNRKNFSQFYVTTSIKKEKPTRKEKICCLGNYSIRYTQLGYHWDGQIRAFNYLGFKNNLYLDLKVETFFSLRKKILKYNPDILWVRLEEYIPFLEYIQKDIKKRNITVIYWYVDMFEPKFLPHLGEIIDYVFITNTHHIPLYKKNYKVEKIFYMPQACTPPFMKYHNLEEIYEIGFAGKRDILSRPKDLRGQKFYYDHNSRTIILRKLAQKYNVKYVEGEYNNISEFYSRCKFVFGGTPHLADFELYASNRFFIAGGCGSVHLTSYFKGIEKLVENEKHVLWFKNENELYSLIDKYIDNKKERFKIKKNALDLFHMKHTYVNRIQNMLDIVNGKTTEFYGFL